MSLPDAVVASVQGRAHDRCEYCQMHQSLQGATFHVEHIVPRNQGGTDDLLNLAWACPSCNLHKSARTAATDPETNATVPLFNPRSDSWLVNFEFRGFELIGISAIGRATVELLQLNHPRRLQIRQAESLFGLFRTDETN